MSIRRPYALKDVPTFSAYQEKKGEEFSPCQECPSPEKCAAENQCMRKKEAMDKTCSQCPHPEKCMEENACLKKSDKEAADSDEDPCWEGYKQVGMKTKDGEKVPNCVPKDENEEKEAGRFEVVETPEGFFVEAKRTGEKLNKDPIESREKAQQVIDEVDPHHSPVGGMAAGGALIGGGLGGVTGAGIIPGAIGGGALGLLRGKVQKHQDRSSIRGRAQQASKEASRTEKVAKLPPAAIGGLLGASAGGAGGYMAQDENKGRNALLGAAAGGSVGAGLGRIGKKLFSGSGSQAAKQSTPASSGGEGGVGTVNDMYKGSGPKSLKEKFRDHTMRETLNDYPI